MQAVSRTSRVISTNHKIKLPIWAQKLVLALALVHWGRFSELYLESRAMIGEFSARMEARSPSMLLKVLAPSCWTFNMMRASHMQR